jgi:hypothetical protein
MKPRRPKRPAEDEAPAPRARPADPAARSVVRDLDEALNWLEALGDHIDDLIFTAQDAASPKPLLTRPSLRRSACEDGVEALRLARFVRRSLEAARGNLLCPRR